MKNRWARAQAANMAAFSPKTIAAWREPSGNDAQIKNRWARAQPANVAASIRGPQLGPNLRALRVFVVNPTRAKALISPFRELPCHSVAKRSAVRGTGGLAPKPLLLPLRYHTQTRHGELCLNRGHLAATAIGDTAGDRTDRQNGHRTGLGNNGRNVEHNRFGDSRTP